VLVTELPAPETEVEILRRGTAVLAERLPSGWSARLLKTQPDQKFDGLIELVAANGEPVILVVEAKRIVDGRDVRALRDKLNRYVQLWPNAHGLVFARYLSPPVRTRLTEEGISYADATGNVRVGVATPGLFISASGADRDPWRGPGRPRGTLKGEPAAKIVRTMSDFARSWTVRDLVGVAKVSTGAAYRVLDYLEREDMVLRDPTGSVEVLDWVRLLRRWSDDYGFVRNSRVTRWIAPRGLS
jgi:hypothetical protein